MTKLNIWKTHHKPVELCSFGIIDAQAFGICIVGLEIANSVIIVFSVRVFIHDWWSIWMHSCNQSISKTEPISYTKHRLQKSLKHKRPGSRSIFFSEIASSFLWLGDIHRDVRFYIAHSFTWLWFDRKSFAFLSATYRKMGIFLFLRPCVRRVCVLSYTGC